MAAYEFWNEFLQAPRADTYEGFRDRMIQMMPRYYHASRAQKKELRAKALALYNNMTDDQLIDFRRGAYRPEVSLGGE